MAARSGPGRSWRRRRPSDAAAMADPTLINGTMRDVELELGLYRQMLVIRRFEELVQSLFLRGEIYGTTHLCSGQEAVSVGFASAFGERDRVACTYRGHGHMLARGTPPEALLGELLGRSTGINGGRAGSMNMIDLDREVIGCFGIVGGSIAAATGAALALKGSGRIATAFFGDGATNQAYFFECLNFAKVLGLPALFVCENNGYGEYTPTDAVTAGTIRGRAEAMDDPGGGRRRDGRLGRAGGGAGSGRAGPSRADARLRRGSHVPVRRPLAQRSGQVPAGGRARGVAAARPAADRRAAARRRARRHGRAAPGRRRRRRAAAGEGRARRARGRLPDPAPFSEFKE